MTQSIRIAAFTMLALFVSAAAAPAVVIRCGDAASFPGGTAVVSVSVEHTEEEIVAGTQNDLLYDSNVFTIDVEAGDCVINPAIGPGTGANKDLNSSQPETNAVRNIIVSLNTVNPIPSGELYTCAFDVHSDATIGQQSITIPAARLVASSPDGTRLPVTSENCVIAIGPTPTPTPRCRENSDCPDGQVCIDGECVTATPTATGTAASTATATPRCRENSDCPDGEVCVDGECVTATPTRTGTATSTVPTPTATPMCRENSDCPDGQVCLDGTCVTATPTSTPVPTKKKKGGGGGCSCEIDPGAGAGPRAADVLAVLLPALVLLMRWRSRRATR